MVNWQPTSSYIVPTQQVCRRQLAKEVFMVIDSSETGTCTHHNQLVSWEKGADMQRGCSDALEADGLSRSFLTSVCAGAHSL